MANNGYILRCRFPISCSSISTVDPAILRFTSLHFSVNIKCLESDLSINHHSLSSVMVHTYSLSGRLCPDEPPHFSQGHANSISWTLLTVHPMLYLMAPAFLSFSTKGVSRDSLLPYRSHTDLAEEQTSAVALPERQEEPSPPHILRFPYPASSD